MSSSEQPVHYRTQLFRSRDLGSLCNATECGNLGFSDVFIPHESQRESNIGLKDNYKIIVIIILTYYMKIIKGCLHGTIATAIFIYATNGMHWI